MKKILYWIGTNFTHYCIAKSLKEKIPNESYAIFDVTNKPGKFFETENIANFEKKWFFHNNILVGRHFDKFKVLFLCYLAKNNTFAQNSLTLKISIACNCTIT